MIWHENRLCIIFLRKYVSGIQDMDLKLTSAPFGFIIWLQFFNLPVRDLFSKLQSSN